ncbi:hypothetical protein [Rhodococcus opacus]|uniref:hypothetical protein n=1 Tax=Rhodococcus opacus TaxID=37919 RepID=UPI002A5A8CC6|nr:hypothetical protein [Rhodococcus opacus]
MSINPDPKGGRRRRFSVGARVRTPHSLDAELPADQWPLASGVIIEDFADSGGLDPKAYGRDWAFSRRWAIALDDGNLIFRDSEDLDDEDPDIELV